MSKTLNLTINATPSVKFSVDKCIHTQFNGEHEVTLDLSNLTSDDVEQYLLQTLVIKYQSKLRSKTADRTITDRSKWVVPAPGTRITTSPEQRKAKVVELASKLSEADKMEIAKAMGFTYVPQGLVTEKDPELEVAEMLTESYEEETDED